MFCLQLHCNTLSYDREPGQGVDAPTAHPGKSGTMPCTHCKTVIPAKIPNCVSERSKIGIKSRQAKNDNNARRFAGMRSSKLDASISAIDCGRTTLRRWQSHFPDTVTTTCSWRRTSGGHIIIDHANDQTRPGIGDIPQRERRPAPSLSRLQAYRDS